MAELNEKIITRTWTQGADEIVPRPAPPPLPEYDINEDVTKWSFSRFGNNLPYIRPKPYPRIGQQPATDDDPDWRGVVRSQIIPIPKPEPCKLDGKQRPYYYWFDTPDYADPFAKLWYGFKFFWGLGGVGWSLDILYRGVPVTEPNRIYYYVRHYKNVAIPFTVAGMAASLAVVTVANLRGKKDDVYNYLAGGFVLGSIIGRKNHYGFFRWTLFYMALGYGVKYMNETNAQIMPILNPRARHLSLRGMTGEDGFLSGDFRGGLFKNTLKYPDPGRDVRKEY